MWLRELLQKLFPLAFSKDKLPTHSPLMSSFGLCSVNGLYLLQSFTAEMLSNSGGKQLMLVVFYFLKQNRKTENE